MLRIFSSHFLILLCSVFLVQTGYANNQPILIDHLNEGTKYYGYTADYGKLLNLPESEQIDFVQKGLVNLQKEGILPFSEDATNDLSLDIVNFLVNIQSSIEVTANDKALYLAVELSQDISVIDDIFKNRLHLTEVSSESENAQILKYFSMRDSIFPGEYQDMNLSYIYDVNNHRLMMALYQSETIVDDVWALLLEKTSKEMYAKLSDVKEKIFTLWLSDKAASNLNRKIGIYSDYYGSYGSRLANYLSDLFLQGIALRSETMVSLDKTNNNLFRISLEEPSYSSHYSKEALSEDIFKFQKALDLEYKNKRTKDFINKVSVGSNVSWVGKNILLQEDILLSNFYLGGPLQASLATIAGLDSHYADQLKMGFSAYSKDVEARKAIRKASYELYFLTANQPLIYHDEFGQFLVMPKANYQTIKTRLDDADKQFPVLKLRETKIEDKITRVKIDYQSLMANFIKRVPQNFTEVIKHINNRFYYIEKDGLLYFASNPQTLRKRMQGETNQSLTALMKQYHVDINSTSFFMTKALGLSANYQKQDNESEQRNNQDEKYLAFSSGSDGFFEEKQQSFVSPNDYRDWLFLVNSDIVRDLLDSVLSYGYSYAIYHKISETVQYFNFKD